MLYLTDIANTAKKLILVVLILFASTDIFSRDLPHWSYCQGHCYHCHVPSADSSGHPESKC